MEEIWPLFRERCPGVPTYIIGSRMPTAAQARRVPWPGVLAREDLMLLMQSVLSIAPLRYGAGVKEKE